MRSTKGLFSLAVLAIMVLAAACVSVPPVNPVDTATAAVPTAEPLPISPPAELIGEWRGEMETELLFEQPSSGAEVTLAAARREVTITIRPDGGAVVLIEGCQLKKLALRPKKDVVVIYRDGEAVVLRGTPPFPDHRVSLDNGTLKVKGFYIKRPG